jgi:hypothetical protein
VLTTSGPAVAGRRVASPAGVDVPRVTHHRAPMRDGGHGTEHDWCGVRGHRHLSPVTGAIIQEVIDVLAVLNALRAAFPPRVIHDL